MTFLARMAEASRARVRAARASESEAALERRAHARPKPLPLALDRFDVIAELKLRSPAAGECKGAASRSATFFNSGSAAGSAVISRAGSYSVDSVGCDGGSPLV